MHPGGKLVIEEHLGKSIDQPFDDTGHSKSAKSYFGTRLPQVGMVLDKIMADKLVVEYDTAYKKSFCCSREFLVKKLFTKEDPIMLHKTLGLFALISFAYRYLYCLPLFGNLGFEGSWFDYFTLIMHMALSSSSMIFHVLPQRIIKRPIVIWEESRLHSIIFTLRSFSAALFAKLWLW